MKEVPISLAVRNVSFIINLFFKLKQSNENG